MLENSVEFTTAMGGRMVGIFRRPKARRYLPKNVDLQTFFRELNNRDVRYVVLRWFETLPELSPGEDVDLLVDDDDVDLIAPLLNGSKTNGIPFDVYAARGLVGFTYHGLPYFEPSVASAILTDTVLLRGIYRVPNPVMHYLSMAYHVVYHKGFSSGIPTRIATVNARKSKSAEHDYKRVLKDITRISELSFPDAHTLEDLESTLVEYNFRPAFDSISKLCACNPWLACFLKETIQKSPMFCDFRGITVFLVREQAAHAVKQIEDQIVRRGFNVLETLWISAAQKESLAKQTRGGNWERGPYPKSGGSPAAAIITCDLQPIPVDITSEPDQPALTNRRTHLVKQALRRWFNTGTKKSAHVNSIHSSDNELEAVEYLLKLDPELPIKIKEDVTRLKANFNPPLPVIHAIKNGYRSRVYLSETKGTPVIVKQFRPGLVRYAAREIHGSVLINKLAEKTGIHAPKILASGELFLARELIAEPKPQNERDTFGIFHHAVAIRPSSQLLAASALVRNLEREGFDLIDFKPDSLLRSAEGKLYIVDLEFLQPRSNEPRIAKCLSWYPANKTYKGDYPIRGLGSNPYRDWWLAFGVPRLFAYNLKDIHTINLVRLLFLPLWIMDVTVRSLILTVRRQRKPNQKPHGPSI